VIVSYRRQSVSNYGKIESLLFDFFRNQVLFMVDLINYDIPQIHNSHVLCENKETPYDSEHRILRFYPKGVWLFQGNSLDESLFEKEFIF